MSRDRWVIRDGAVYLVARRGNRSWWSKDRREALSFSSRDDAKRVAGHDTVVRLRPKRRASEEYVTGLEDAWRDVMAEMQATTSVRARAALDRVQGRLIERLRAAGGAK